MLVVQDSDDQWSGLVRVLFPAMFKVKVGITALECPKWSGQPCSKWSGFVWVLFPAIFSRMEWSQLLSVKGQSGQVVLGSRYQPFSFPLVSIFSLLTVLFQSQYNFLH